MDMPELPEPEIESTLKIGRKSVRRIPPGAAAWSGVA